MPLFFDALVKLGHPKFTAWRLAFYMPAAMHVLSGILIFLFGQDTPAGRTAAVRKAAGLKNDMSWPSWRAAVLNYRTWALTAVYAVTFGTGELIGIGFSGRVVVSYLNLASSLSSLRLLFRCSMVVCHGGMKTESWAGMWERS